MSEPQPSTGHLSRRRVLQGALWTAPAIVIATSAPAFAGSGDKPVLALNVDWGYVAGGVIDTGAQLQWINPSGTPGTPAISSPLLLIWVPTAFGVTTVDLGGSAPMWSYVGSAPDGSDPNLIIHTFALNAELSVDMQNANFSVTMTVTGPATDSVLYYQGMGQAGALGSVSSTKIARTLDVGIHDHVFH